MRHRLPGLQGAVAVLCSVLALGLSRPAAALDCKGAAPTAAGDFVVTIDPSTAWQPRGGQVRLIVQSNTQSLKDLTVAACFKWSGLDDAGYQPAPLVQLVETVGDVPGRAVYAVSVPEMTLTRLQSGWFDRFGGSASFAKKFPNDPQSFDAADIVPFADLKFVLAKPNGPTVTAVRSLGITSVWTAALLTGGAVVFALTLLAVWARLRKVPGTDPLMRLVATRDGYVSLSQFQIVMWSFLFGAGAVYVMGLSGSLIDIPTGALVLLGISGATIIGAKINEANVKAQPSAAPPPSVATAAPGAATGLTLTNVTDGGVTLSWTAPAAVAGAPVAAYVVRYARTGFADWRIASSAIQETQFRVTGLRPETAYLFDVRASNAAGQGPAVQEAATTLPPQVVTRVPAWSDLVVTPEHPGEIDVTRVQMLFFTLIAAGFVAIKLFNSYVIPEIPQGILILMGISNGTYLSAKFVRS